RQFVDHTFEEAVLQVARGPGKGSQAAGALGAAQVAGGGGLDADADGKPLDARHLRPFRLTEAAPDAVGIARPAQRERTGPQAGIAEFGQHGRKVPVRGPGHSDLRWTTESARRRPFGSNEPRIRGFSPLDRPRRQAWPEDRIGHGSPHRNSTPLIFPTLPAPPEPALLPP